MSQKVEGTYTVFQETFSLRTKGNNQVLDITDTLEEIVVRSHIRSGICHVFCPGSTGIITTMEYEAGLVQDLRSFLETWAPESYPYQHNYSHGDGNGHAHIRSSLLGPSLVLPVCQGQLHRGVWQQVVFIDCDNRPRSRHLLATIMGV